MKAYFLLLSLLIAHTLLAQTDVEGSSDHPLLTRYPDAYIASYETEKFREYSFATGPVTKYRFIEEKTAISGQLYRITYLIEKTTEEISLGEVYEDYIKAIQQAKIDVLAKGFHSSSNVSKQVGGGIWMGVALKPNTFTKKTKANFLFAGTSTSGGSFAIMGQVPRPDGKTYVGIYGERHSEDLMVIHVDIIEEKAADIGYVLADADYIARELESKGTVSIYGIHFDFDSAVIKETSKPALDEIAKYLEAHPEENLYVVGHTDMKGTLTYNLALSKKRAQAVLDKLRKDYNLNTAQLAPDGVGPLAPVSTNATEEGRALNRRVELVRKGATE